MNHRLRILSALIIFAFPLPLTAATPNSQALQGVGIDQDLGAQVPLNLTFRDETGSQVSIDQLRHGRPIVLALVQLRCPSLCTVVLNDMLSSLKMIPQNIGDQYDVWTVSFDPNEGPDLAAPKKAEYLKSYLRAHSSAANASAGWHFLTGDAANIKALTQAVGFHYKWDDATSQFIHPAGLIILTPDAKVSRYFFGVDYDPTDLRLSLVEASGGKIGTFTDQVLLFCCRYDPTTGKYGFAVMRALQIGGAATLLLLGMGMGLLWRIDRRRTRRGLSAVAQGTGRGTS